MALNEDSDIQKIVDTYFKAIPSGEKPLEYLRMIKNFEVKDTDTFLVGYPKSGTTWAQEMIWLIGNDLDFEGAKAFIDERIPLLDACIFDPKECNPEIETPFYHTHSITYAENLRSPRFIKTHISGPYLPDGLFDGTKKAKIIYIVRNPKDVCVSAYYYFKNILKLYSGNLEDFCEVFLAGKGLLPPYWAHVLFFWERREQDNILFIKYEDMKKDLSGIIKKVAKFLDKPITDEQMETLLNVLSLEHMKTNNSVNRDVLYHQSGFIRTGRVGGHKKEMSSEMIEKFDCWIRENSKNSGLYV